MTDRPDIADLLHHRYLGRPAHRCHPGDVDAVQQALYSKRTGGETLPLDVAETELRYAADLIGDDR